MDCIYNFPIDFEPKRSYLVSNQSENGKYNPTQPNSENLSICSEIKVIRKRPKLLAWRGMLTPKRQKKIRVPNSYAFVIPKLLSRINRSRWNLMINWVFRNIYTYEYIHTRAYIHITYFINNNLPCFTTIVAGYRWAIVNFCSYNYHA